MKKTIKVILSSAVSMAVCASLIAGSTFALFTGESDVNIAITSGKIDVTASAEIQKVWSAEWNGSEYTDVDIDDDNGDGTYIFTNEGTASYEGGTLSLNNISPGDGVEFKVTVNNESTISVRYQMRIALKDTVLGENGEKLSDRLQADIVDETVAGKYGAITGEWSDPIDEGATIEPFTVKVYLPIDTENAYQQLASELTLGVYAVQGNAGDSTPLADVIVNSAEGLSEALTDFAESTETDIVLGLMGNTAITDAAPIMVPANKDLTLDVNGNGMQLEQKTNAPSGIKGCVEVGAGSSLTITDSSSVDGADGEGTLDLTITKEGGSNYKEGGAYPFHLDGTADQKAELNFKDVQVNVTDQSEGANIVGRVSHGVVNFEEGTQVELTGGAYSALFYVGDQSEVNIYSGAKISAHGSQVTPFVVGGASDHDGVGQSKLNLNGGEIDVEGGNSAMGIQVGAGGMVNMNSGTIKVTGDLTLSDSIKENTAACTAIGIDNRYGGWHVADSAVNIIGGEIVLEPTKGTAYGITVWPGTAQIFLGGNFQIHCNAAEPAYAFALCCSVSFMQKDYGNAIPCDMVPSITLQGNVQIDYDNERNMLFSGRTNGTAGLNADWKANADNIHDETPDKRFEKDLLS